MIQYDPYMYKAWRERMELKRQSMLSGIAESHTMAPTLQALARSRRDYQQTKDPELMPTKVINRRDAMASMWRRSAYKGPTLRETVQRSGLMSRWAGLGHIRGS